jgi:hypothetical protein
LRQFAVSGDGRSLDAALLYGSLQACGRVSVMGVHKIGDEKSTDVRHD